jgi:hypothetical protein
VWYCFLATPVLAATSVSISNISSQVDQDDQMEFDVSLVCTSCSSDSFLRGVFYPSGTSYFGFTQNKDSAWINAPAASCTQYYKVTPLELVEGSWSGKLKVKIDKESSYYAGPGEYVFKVGRYTASCSSPTWSQETTVAVKGPSPTPTPTPLAFTPTSTIVPTQVLILPTVTPTKIATPVPTKIISSTPYASDATSSGELVDIDESSMILGESINISSEGAMRVPQKRPLREFGIAAAMIAAGLALLSGVLVWQRRNSLQDI